jgi:hypothetical protein
MTGGTIKIYYESRNKLANHQDKMRLGDAAVVEKSLGIYILLTRGNGKVAVKFEGCISGDHGITKYSIE